MTDDIRSAQEQLARTLARAHSDEDRELLSSVREQGAQLAHLLYGLLRMARTHALNNTAFDQPVAELERRARSLYDLLGPITLVCVEDQVYVNDVRVRFESAIDEAGPLQAELLRHNSGGVTINEPLAESAVRELIRVLTGPAAHAKTRTALQAELDRAGLDFVEALPTFRFQVTGEDTQHLDRDFHSLYHSAAPIVAEAFANLGAGRLPNPLPSRRLVNQLIDAGIDGSALDRGLDEEKSLPEFARHTMMVATLALLIGRGAGLSNSSLADLGVAAMFHDVGYSLKEDGFTVPYERHARAGLGILLRQRGFHRAKIGRLLAVLQHHRPVTDQRGIPALFARVIHIADDYDILTRTRPGFGPALSAPDAISRMAAQGGKAYDPLLLQIFINSLGPLPPGSLCQLSDGRIVAVASAVRSPETFATPLCRVLRLGDGSKPTGTVDVDLATAGVRVVKVLRPSAS